ncbi:LOW QUALITY PROTEIN: bromo adjacent homology domain-containing 1 protein [Thamnophis elegans]|uniref:LOW QUALITY PROTEIN: bromo adjacent homology domain-containing 1 protein n=1 Tax=Thamnophis elegans TaxID=35005 RepID=UPI0013772F97|nr:LOW QUALITY PROTEIN: bromo adjacent homology domain-containing 1 protein [Thamnophis elegans]
MSVRLSSCHGVDIDPMTHARKKQLLLLKYSAAGQALSPIDGERMDRTEVEGSKQGNGTEGQKVQTRLASTTKSRNLQELRKTYPLRKRLSSSVDKKTCSVLLTRLEDVAGSLSEETPRVVKRGLASCIDDFRPSCLPEQVQVAGAGKQDCSIGKCQLSCLGTEEEGHNVCLSEPRKRRLASLNAEAVNNLLFERNDNLLSGRRFRKDSPQISGICCTNSICCKAQGSWPLTEKRGTKTAKGKNQTKSSQKCAPYNQSPGGDFEGKRREEKGIPYHPAPKRLASLNAAAFLKLTHEKDQPLKPRSKSTGESKMEGHSSKSKLKWAKANGKNCVKSKKEISSVKIEGQRSWQGVSEGAFRQAAHQDSPRIYGKTESISYTPSPNSSEGTEGFFHRLPLLMGGQASMKPEYGRPGEKSPTPKQEFHQPSFPVPQFHPLPVPGNHPDCGCLFESSDLNAFYVYYGQSGYNSYSHCSMYPKDELSQATGCEALLVSPGSLPSDPSFQPFHWCSSPYCCGEGPAINSFSLCGVMHVPESRIGSGHTGRNGYPYKMPFAADSCKSLDQLSLTIPVAGHPVSPAHPLSGCPVPSVPPAAEPVPHLQTPNSEPQTMARECPQSSKPPSGSKSGLRNTTSCLHVSDSKTVGSHLHPKQQRINRRRATNGWIPIGAASEKAVYVVNEPEPAVRKSYQAVERDGEIIRVRDTVLLKSGPRKKSMPYVAKISALWEDPKTGELMMSLLWYYRPEHTQGGRNSSMHQNEIFASRHQDENSVACIEEKCYVLTFAEYCRFCALAKRRVEGIPGKKTVMVPPSEEYSTPAHRKVPEDTDPELVFLCRHVYDFRHGRILKNPQ